LVSHNVTQLFSWLLFISNGSIKTVYNEDRRFAKMMPNFIFSGGIILAVTFFVGFIFGKIVN